MAAVKEEDNLNPDDIVVPNELSKSVDDPYQSERLDLTIRLQNDLGRKCYVDPHEAFPQATYYLDPNLKRPNYYLKKEQKFNKKVLLPNVNDNNMSPSPQKSQSSPNRKKKKKKSKRAQNQSDPNNLKMEVESESESDDDEEEFDDSNDSNVFDADDELFSASEVNLSKGDMNKEDKDKNFLSVFPKRKQDDDQKSESYELDNDKIKKMKQGQRGFSIDEDVFIDKTKKVLIINLYHYVKLIVCLNINRSKKSLEHGTVYLFHVY